MHLQLDAVGRDIVWEPRTMTASWILVVMMEDAIDDVEEKTHAAGMPMGAECLQRYSPWQMRACTRHN